MTDYFWLIPFIPALSTLILVLFGQKLPKKYVSFQACFAVFAAFAISVISFIGLLQTSHDHLPIIQSLFSWIHACSFHAEPALQLDPPSSILPLAFTGLAVLVLW